MEDIDYWIQWSREHLPADGEIPLINSFDLDFPWIDQAWELFMDAELEGPDSRNIDRLQTFREKLSRDPSDIPARFTALHFYFTAATCHSPIRAEMSAQLRDAFLGDFSILVCMLPIEEVPAEWRVIQWEIANACAIRDWDRAERLHRRARMSGAIEQLDLELLMAQFRFLVVFIDADERVLEPSAWVPRIVSLKDSEAAYAIYDKALLEQGKPPAPRNETQRGLDDIRNDVEKAIGKNQDIPHAYRAMLARSCFELGEFSKAAEAYASLCDAETVLQRLNRDKLEEALGVWGYETHVCNNEELRPAWIRTDFKPRVYFSIVRSAQQGGDLELARNVLRRWRFFCWRLRSRPTRAGTRRPIRASAARSSSTLTCRTISVLGSPWPWGGTGPIQRHLGQYRKVPQAGAAGQPTDRWPPKDTLAAVFETLRSVAD